MADANNEAADLTPLPVPEANGSEITAAGEESTKVGDREDEKASSGSAGEDAAESKEVDDGGDDGGGDADAGEQDEEGPTDEELALLEPPRREVHNVLFRVDMSGINAAANFVKRAEVKDFLDIFFVVSRLLGEEWTVWTQHAALVYLHHDRSVRGVERDFRGKSVRTWDTNR